MRVKSDSPTGNINIAGTIDNRSFAKLGYAIWKTVQACIPETKMSPHLHKRL
jgi:hypothetical protein